jgi:hypothetical protein
MNENAKMCSVPDLKYFLMIRSNIRMIILQYRDIIIPHVDRKRTKKGRRTDSTSGRSQINSNLNVS